MQEALKINDIDKDSILRKLKVKKPLIWIDSAIVFLLFSLVFILYFIFVNIDSSHEAKIKELEDQFQKTITQINAEKDSLKDNNSHLKSTLQDVHSEIVEQKAITNKKINQLLEDKSFLQTELESAKDEIKKIENEQQELQRKNANLLTQKSLIEEQNKKLNQENKQLTLQIDILQKENDSLKIILDPLPDLLPKSLPTSVSKSLSDLKIIQRLEQELGRKLKKFRSSDSNAKYNSFRNSYIVDEHNNVLALSLDYYEFSSIPNYLLSLNNLIFLSINTGKIKFLPDSFGKLKNLIYLGITNNQLIELPTSFQKLQKLEHLYLSSNQLRKLPTSFQKLQKLKHLDLSNNQLTELPILLDKMRNLHVFTIKINPLCTSLTLERIQKYLNKLKFYKGSIDGVFGSNTNKAIKKFKRHHKIQSTDESLDKTTCEKLKTGILN